MSLVVKNGFFVCAVLLLASVLVFGGTVIETLVLLGVTLLFALVLFFPSLGMVILIIPTKFTQIRELSGLEIISVKHIVIVALLVVIIHRVVYKGERIKVPYYYFIAYLFLVLFATLSLLYTPDLLYGLEKVFEMITVTSFVFLAPFFLINEKESLHSFLLALAGLGSFLAFVFITLGLAFSFEAVTGLFGFNYIALGYLSVMSIIILLYHFPKNLLTISSIILLSITIVLSGAKGPIVVMILTIFIMFFCRSAKVADFSKLILISLLLFLIVLSPFGIHLLYRSLSFVSYGDLGGVIRVVSLQESGKMILENPIFGQGIGGFADRFVKETGTNVLRYPHNIFTEVFAEVGIFGFIAFIFLIISSLRSAFRGENTTFFALLILVILGSFLSGNINNQAIFLYMSLSKSLE